MQCTLKPCQALRSCSLQDFPSLILRSQQYTHTNGAVVPLLMAEGTVPMYYQVPISHPPLHEVLQLPFQLTSYGCRGVACIDKE